MLYNCEIRNCRHGASTIIAWSNKVFIINCRFLNNGASDSSFLCDHMWMGGNSWVLINNCYFDNCTDVGCAMDNCQHVAIVNCIFRNCKCGAFTWYDVDSDWPVPNDLLIANCIINQANCNCGCYIGSGTGRYPERVRIINCEFHGNGSTSIGIDIRKGSKIEIEHCTIGWHKDYGIKADDAHWLEVRNSTINDVSVGIYFTGSGEKGIIENVRFIAISDKAISGSQPNLKIGFHEVDNTPIGGSYYVTGIITRVDVGDYGGNFANYTPPEGKEGMIIVAIDTNSTSPGKRLYVYANGAWHYVDLT